MALWQRLHLQAESGAVVGCCLAALAPCSSFVCSLLSFGLIPPEGVAKLLLLFAPVASELVPSADVDVKRLHVPLAVVFEAEEGVSPWPLLPEANSPYRMPFGASQLRRL